MAKRYGLAEGDIDLAKERYGDSVEWCSDDPPVAGKYDLIVLYNWLQQAEQPQVSKLLRYYTELLKEGGTLMVIVPSLDWAAGQIAHEDNPSIAAYTAVYGTPSEPHRSGLTMNWLRIVASQTPGLRVDFANTEGIIVKVGDERQMAQQNAIGCTKVTPDAGDAIE